MAIPGVVTLVNVISIAEIQWQTNPLTGRWEELPPNWGFNPATLFAPEVGLQAILTEDMTGLTLAGREPLAGVSDESLYVLSGKVGGERLAQISGGLIGPEETAVRMWIRPGTYELVRVVLTGPASTGEEPGVWQVDFSQYDQTVEIAPPQ